MSKITFRADEDLVEDVERLDASKSEVMREALRAYLDGAPDTPGRDGREHGSIDDIILDRIDALVAERLADPRAGTKDVNVNVSIEPGSDAVRTERADDRGDHAGRDDRDAPATDTAERTCGQCGEEVSDGATYCQNCGEKVVNRVFCDCGDELRTDWAYCPGCGRRTPSADVL